MSRMLKHHLHPGFLLLFIWLCHLMEHQKVQAGNCWLQQGKNGRCQVLYMSGMSREECCRSGRLGTSWTEEDVPNSTLFRWMIFNGGAPNCIPCKESCDNVDCGPGKRCKMNRRSKPRCVCAPDCTNITWKGPVCGSDGKTYKDECALLKAKCKGHPDLDVQYQGKCKKTCRDVLCPGSSTCVVDQTNNAYCVTCNRICPEVTSPEQYLCGNDGIVYASACHLRRATCLLGRSIGVAYEGKCIKAKSCEDIQCSAGKKCLWDARMSRGRCSMCGETCPESRTDEAVCASDNTTYPSECAMKQAACSLGALLEAKHLGSCNWKHPQNRLHPLEPIQCRLSHLVTPLQPPPLQSLPCALLFYRPNVFSRCSPDLLHHISFKIQDATVFVDAKSKRPFLTQNKKHTHTQTHTNAYKETKEGGLCEK
uniref:Follistatin n=1 Tax=Gasterosteus aculeatus aculeatus TaxID=481459 RepID=A0AAQ4RQY8_GASAC